MVLCKFSVPRPIVHITVRQWPTTLAVCMGCLDIFLSSIISPFYLPRSGRRSDID